MSSNNLLNNIQTNNIQTNNLSAKTLTIEDEILKDVEIFQSIHKPGKYNVSTKYSDNTIEKGILFITQNNISLHNFNICYQIDRNKFTKLNHSYNYNLKKIYNIRDIIAIRF